MNWTDVLEISVALAGGWTCGIWQCSKRSDCPKYNQYRLAKWKRDAETRMAQDRPKKVKEEPRETE